MGKMNAWLMAGVALVALTGCGHSPASAPATFKASTKASAKVAAPVAKAPAASVKASAPAAKATPAPAKTAAPEAASDTGSIQLAIDVTGTATVKSLALKVFEQADPEMAADVPLTLTAGKATFTQDDVPPGRYTFQVQAIGEDGTVLGQGSTEAIVSAGKPSEVALELRVNTAGSSSVASDEEEESTDDGTTTTPATGGVIGLMVEII